jgi:hypothetical protein
VKVTELLEYGVLADMLRPKIEAGIIERYGNFLQPKELEHLGEIGLKAMKAAVEKARDLNLEPPQAIPQINTAIWKAISDEFFANGKHA